MADSMFWDHRFEKKEKIQYWIFKNGLKGCAVHQTQFPKGFVLLLEPS